ncbi:MAG: hypothetical protein ACTSV7_00825 [Candidatus Baldrarchaeia archaeon]
MGRIVITKTACKIDTESKTITCEPEWIQDGHKVKAAEPTVLRLDGGRAQIVNEGSAPPEVIDTIMKRIEKRIL